MSGDHFEGSGPAGGDRRTGSPHHHVPILHTHPHVHVWGVGVATDGLADASVHWRNHGHNHWEPPHPDEGLVLAESAFRGHDGEAQERKNGDAGRSSMAADQACRLERPFDQQREYLFHRAMELLGEATAAFSRAEECWAALAELAAPQGMDRLSEVRLARVAPSEPGLRSARPVTALGRIPVDSELTGRQWEVVALIARGCSNREIARQLVVTRGTAANHVSQILDRLGFNSRIQIAVWAAQRGLVTEDLELNDSRTQDPRDVREPRMRACPTGNV